MKRITFDWDRWRALRDRYRKFEHLGEEDFSYFRHGEQIIRALRSAERRHLHTKWCEGPQAVYRGYNTGPR